MTELTFQAWPKTPRLFTDITITEKLDGTNACVIVTDDGKVGAQSRSRLLPTGPRGMDDRTWQKEDNHGFAAWVREHTDGLVEVLGPGHHFGEWWGWKIQRGYGLEKGDRRFSLFNTAKWGHFADPEQAPNIPGLGVVPRIYEGPWEDDVVETAALLMGLIGSVAAPGYDRPEGICVFHKAASKVFKVIIDK